jgi:hypothetical protein
MSATYISRIAASAVLAAAMLMPTQPASAQLDPRGTGNCRVGGTVSTRDGRVGVVAKAEGNSCTVRLNDGTDYYALQWMLTPVRAGAKASGSAAANAAGGKVTPGNYQCYGGPAGNMRVTLTGPRYGEAYAVALGNGKVGLSMRPTGPFYMTCERR